MVKSPNGYPIQWPYIAIANRQAEIMLRIASEFGFTPASRSRIATPSPAEPSLFDLMVDEPADSIRFTRRSLRGLTGPISPHPELPLMSKTNSERLRFLSKSTRRPFERPG
jgi:hypothetical protein